MIHRHAISRDVKSELPFLQDRFIKNQNRLVKQLGEGASVNLNGYKNTGLELGTFLLTASLKENVYPCLYSYLELGIGHFQLELNSQPSVIVQLNKQKYKIDHCSSGEEVSLFDWWNLLNMSLVLRTDDLKDELILLFERSSAMSHDPFWKRSMDLILMCLSCKEFQDYVLDDLKAIVRSAYVAFHGSGATKLVKSVAGAELRKKLWLPIMELFFLAFHKKEEQFNACLEEYILSKKKWIVDNNEEDNSSYWIDFPLLAACSFAYDLGVSITVSSDYIPDFVYARELIK